MPEPGWIPKHTQPPESRECMRLAVSCASGIHWRRLRFFDPADLNVRWWDAWDRLLVERGHKIVRMEREQAEASGHYWLATVDSFVYPKPVTHVIVMKGKKLHYDSAQIKRRLMYPGMEEDYSRPLLDGRAKDIYGVRIMLRIVGHCFWNYYEAKEKRREQGL